MLLKNSPRLAAFLGPGEPVEQLTIHSSEAPTIIESLIEITKAYMPQITIADTCTAVHDLLIFLLYVGLSISVLILFLSYSQIFELRHSEIQDAGSQPTMEEAQEEMTQVKMTQGKSQDENSQRQNPQIAQSKKKQSQPEKPQDSKPKKATPDGKEPTHEQVQYPNISQALSETKKSEKKGPAASVSHRSDPIDGRCTLPQGLRKTEDAPKKNRHSSGGFPGQPLTPEIQRLKPSFGFGSGVWPNPQKFQPQQSQHRTTWGAAGTPSHEKDYEAVQSALNSLCKESHRVKINVDGEHDAHLATFLKSVPVKELDSHPLSLLQTVRSHLAGQQLQISQILSLFNSTDKFGRDARLVEELIKSYSSVADEVKKLRDKEARVTRLAKEHTVGLHTDMEEAVRELGALLAAQKTKCADLKSELEKSKAKDSRDPRQGLRVTLTKGVEICGSKTPTQSSQPNTPSKSKGPDSSPIVGGDVPSISISKPGGQTYRQPTCTTEEEEDIL